jgi:hypothetical protein
MSSGKWCPLIRKNCVEHKCAFYTHVMGHNPNTGQQVDEWACSIQFLPMLLIENSQQQRGTGAAVESFRNEMVKANQSNINILEAAANMFSTTHQAKIKCEETEQKLITDSINTDTIFGDNQ